MRALIAALLAASLPGAAQAANLTTDVGKVHGRQSVITCVVTCPPGAVNENEPICYDGYYDGTNGGCNTTGWTNLYPQSGNVGVGCGTSGTYYYEDYSYRDTDWWQCISDGSGLQTMSVEAEFAPLLILIYTPSGTVSCASYSYVYTFGTACDATTSTVSAVAGCECHAFWPWVGTQVFGYGVPCGSRYTMTVTGIMFEGGCEGITGACCLPDGTCEVLNPIPCMDSEGSWMGNGSCCTPGLCSATPVERDTWGGVKTLFR